MCVLFWSLAKPMQDSILWRLQQDEPGMREEGESQEEEPGPRRRHQWYIQGPVLRNNHILT